MTRNGLVAAFLVLIFAMALGLLLLDPEPLRGVLEPEARPGQRAPEAGALDAADGTPGDAGGFVRQSGDGGPSAAAGDAEDGGQGPGILVRTVDAETGEPVAGATVRVLDVPVADREATERARVHPPGLHGLLAEAPSWRTHADGTVRVPFPEGLLVADASRGSRYGQVLVDVDRPVQTVTLELAPDLAVRARVVDSDGRPVSGVPVALQTRAPRWSSNHRIEETDAEGRVRFAHAGTALRGVRGGEHWVAVLLPAMPEAAERVDPEDDDAGRERLLRMPDTGSVTVRVLGYDGMAFPRPVEVLLRQDDDGQARRNLPPLAYRAARATAEEGIASFPRVGIGHPLLAAAQLDASDDWFRVAGEGPQAPGEEVELVLRQDEVRPQVSFRVVTADGQPLAGAEIRVTERGRTSRSSSERTRRVMTDADGVLRYAPRQGPLAPMESRHLELRWFAGRSQGPWTGTRDISFDLPPGETMLADVRMEPPQLLAAGTVTGPRGEPVGGARVRLYVPREDNRAGRVRWRMHPGGETRSDDSGRFAIEGAPPGSAMQLRASHPRYLGGSVPGVEGAPDHRIVLGAGRTLAGRLLVDDEAMHDHLAVAFVPEGADGQRRRGWFRGGRREEVEPDGSFDFGAMDEQRGVLQVLDRRSGLVLHEVPGVAPWLAESPPDDRLDPLDLRGRIVGVEVSFLDMQRQPVSDVRFSIMLPGEEESWWSRTRDGTAELFAPPGGIDMLVRTDGYRHVTLHGVNGEREVVLEPAVPLVFELESPALASEFQLEVRIRRDDDGPDVDPSRRGLDRSGRAEATASGAGPIHVYLRVTYQDDEGRRSARYVDFDGLGRRLVYDVRDSAAVQRVPLRVSRDAILRAMDR